MVNADTTSQYLAVVPEDIKAYAATHFQTIAGSTNKIVTDQKMKNYEICDIVPSQKENNKINVQGYLMGRAVTTFHNRSHYLKKFVEHDHSPQPSNAEVAKNISQIKQKACTTKDKPIQIIQDITVNMSQEYYPYMLSSNALRSIIKRIKRAEMPAELQTIEEVNIPDSLCLTLNGDTS
ncbi:11978_t:CDS:2 [Funneliformis geosporum]|uniref:11978_t:CDS:1 n=1 Tax=Funneliformis geosporum TaxID=1117311 RepID=A0A9W4SW44_9GLOM|nr:11978_t:CDS:2 [Funneliformis geosporum]